MILDAALPTPEHAGGTRTTAGGRARTTRSQIECLYDAAADPALWQTVLHHLQDAFGTQAELLFVADAPHGDVDLVAAKGVSAGFREAFQAFAGDNAWRADGRTLTESRYYADWMRPQGLEHVLGAILHAEAGVVAGIVLLRAARRGPFEASERAAFNRLRRHLARATRLGLRLGTLGGPPRLGDIAGVLLDADPTGLVLLDSRGQTLHYNAAAATMTGDGIRFTDRRLRLEREADDRLLQRLIATALGHKAEGGAMPALRPSGKRPYAITVAPLPVHGQSISHRATVRVAISDPEARPILRPATLHDLYGLSQAEAVLALRLASGSDLRTAAAGLGIRYSTARTQMAAIFRKTGTQRQGQLIRLLLTLPQTNRTGV